MPEPSIADETRDRALEAVARHQASQRAPAPGVRNRTPAEPESDVTDALAAYMAGFDGDPGPAEPPPNTLRQAEGVHSVDPPGGRLAERLLTRSALRSLPAPEPLIVNTLDMGTTALLYGKWGTAKSFIALDWAASVATGRRWQNRHTERRRVLYVAAEGAFGLRARFDAWETGWQTKIDDAGLHILPSPVNLTRTPDVLALMALIEDRGYDFVILDTLARCMVGADENSAKDTGVVVDAMTRLLEHTPGGRGVILGVHHAGKDGKTLRGSSAFESGVDCVYFTSRDGDVINLERQKRKDGPEHDAHELRIDPVPGTGSAGISVHRGGGQTQRADKLLTTFVHHFSTTGASKAELRKVADMPDTTFFRAVSDLVKSGDLINEGTDKRPYYRLAPQ